MDSAGGVANDGDEDDAPAPAMNGQMMTNGAAMSANPQPSPDLAHHQKLERWIASPNIASELDDEVLTRIGMRVKREYEVDCESRYEWLEKTKTAMDLAMQVAVKKTYPWPGASNVIFPLMTTAAMQFAARAYPAIVQNKAVVRGVVVGPDMGMPMMGPQGPMIGPGGQVMWMVPPGAKQERADRIGEHMSWQLLEEMPEWEPETDQMLHILPIAGCVFRKTYFDPLFGRNFSVMRSPVNVVINYRAKSLDTVPRITEEVQLYPLEIEELERSGAFLDIEYGAEDVSGDAGLSQANDEDAPREFLEQHRSWDLDEDGYAEPYIVTVHKMSSRVVRIRARYDEIGVKFDAGTHKVARIEPIHYFTKYDFIPNPDGGIYGVGFGQLLGPINEAVNTSLNQLIDAGHLANTGGGFIGRGLSMNTGAIRFTPGEYKMVNVPGSTVKDNIVPMTFPGPSMVLFQLLQLLISAAKDVAAVKDVLTGEQDQHNVPATTTLALIEQGLKVFSAIYKRVYRALKEEFRKLYRLNRVYLPMEASYQIGDMWKQISQRDYAVASGVVPVSDPGMVSDTQRMAQAQFLMQFIQDPAFNGMEIRKRILNAAHIERPEQLIVAQIPPNPAVIVKGMELQIKAEREKAAELKDLAQAILFFAQADAAVGDMHLSWVQSQLSAWKAQFEASQPGPQRGAGGVGAGAGSPPPASPPTGGPPAPTPDNNAPGPGGPVMATAGVPTGATQQQLPAGARQAPDGRWYIPDPARPGRYLMAARTPQSVGGTA